MYSGAFDRARRATDTTRRGAARLIAGSAMALAAGLALPGLAIAADADEIAKPAPLGDRVLGDADAPVTIVEYASMTCPHCASFHATVLPDLKKDYIDTGKAKLVFREFPLDNRALAASMVARCVEGDAFFAFNDVLFRQQRQWASPAVEPEAAKAHLVRLAKQVGISEESFDKCISNQDVLKGILAEMDRAKGEFEVTSTPTVFVNGQKMQAGASAEEIGQAIEAEL